MGSEQIQPDLLACVVSSTEVNTPENIRFYLLYECVVNATTENAIWKRLSFKTMCRDFHGLMISLHICHHFIPFCTEYEILSPSSSF